MMRQETLGRKYCQASCFFTRNNKMTAAELKETAKKLLTYVNVTSP